MPSQVTNYQCPACTGPLHFDSASGKLICDYCGSSFDVEEIEALFSGKDAKAGEAFRQAESQATEELPTSKTPKAELIDDGWDGSTIAADWGEEGENMRSYNCPSCGAELLCEATTAASQCPYCGNPSIVPGQFGGSLKPDYIIPFKLDKDAAVEALKRHFRKRPFLPRTFTSSSQLHKIQGVYVPFWLFSGSAEAECSFEGQNSHTHREGDYRITKTDHYDVYRSGTVRFENIPTDASRKMPDAMMDSLEPFGYDELKAFSTAYLPGYMADKYDVTIEENAVRADKRCKATAADEMRRDVHGYQAVIPRRQNIALKRESVRYALLPVWMMCVKWQGKSFLYAMNGQTGKFVGDLPVDKKRYWGLCGAITAALGVLFYLTGVGAAVARLLTLILE